MPPADADAEKTHRLRAVAEQTRLRVIEAELTLVMTWCSVAMTEAELGEKDRFRKSFQRIQRAVALLRKHINEPAHVPAELADGFRDKLELLDRKIEQLEAMREL